MATATKRIPAGAGTPNGDRTNSRVGHYVGTSVPHQDDDIPGIHEMNARGRRIAQAYYESGVTAGIEMGRRLAEEEMAALWRQAHAVVQHVARQPTYEQLAERRQEPQRAKRQRQLLSERGLAA